MTVTVLGNPVSTPTVEVVIAGAVGQRLVLEVVNLNGRTLSTQTVESAEANQTVSLQLGEQPGLRLIRVSSMRESKVVKVLKE